MSLSSSTTPAVVYPETDGEPMAEGSIQYQWIVMIREGLENLFAKRPDVYLASDMFWYPVEGDPDIRVAPDVMVVFGRPKGHRPSYKQWEEGGIPPEVVFEILSPGNRAAEMKDKLRFYEQHGVTEYYVYDPYRVELKGYQRSADKLRPMTRLNGWASPLLGVRFDLSGQELVIVRPNGSPLRPVQEIFNALDETTAELERTVAKAEAMAAKADAIAAERDRIARERDELLATLRAAGIKLPE